MFFRILKKDLFKKISMNFIMLLFILLASMFMGSSVNNFVVSTNAVNHFFEVANTADVVAVIAGTDEVFSQADAFLEQCDKISSYDKDITIMGVDKKLYDENGDNLYYGNSDMSVYLTKNPQKHSLIFDKNDKAIVVKDGEIAVPNIFADNTGSQIGDQLTLRIDDYEKQYTISAITKDAGFGTTLGSTTRIVMSDHDYDEISYRFPIKVAFYHVVTEDIAVATQVIGENISELKSIISINILKLCYIFDVMLAIIMLTISICLLLVAFMILRFTIVFTLEDDIKEIGVMKALGLRNRSIRILYLSKYFVISLIGSAIGCLCSIPFGYLLNTSLRNNIIVASTGNLVWINFLCGIFVIAIVALFCYGCTSKLNRFSTVDAIRCGSKGESYSSKSKIKLEKRKKMSVPFTMALNDIFSGFRRYIVITTTYFICLLLMIIPLIAVDTMKDPDRTLSLIGMHKGCVYVYLPDKELVLQGNRQVINDYLHTMETRLSDAGINATVSTSAFLSSKIEYPDGNGFYGLLGVMPINDPKSSYIPTAGSLPQNKNEFAMNENAFKELGGKIGDSYTIMIGDQSYKLLLTGTYNNMNNLGKSFYILDELEVDFGQISALSVSTVFFNDSLSGDQFQSAYEEIKNIFSDTTVYNESEIAEDFMGSYITMFRNMKTIATIIVTIIVFLVSLLMTKSFISRSVGEIALLKSMGFTNQNIQKRYIYRIILCLITATTLMYITIVPLANVVMFLAYSMIGTASTVATINPLSVFLIHPLIVLAVIFVAGYLGSLKIYKVDPKKVNTIE